MRVHSSLCTVPSPRRQVRLCLCFLFCVRVNIQNVSFHSVSSAFDVAHGTFCKEQGVVVDIWNRKGGMMLFEALLWSDFTSEREYFFIGGLEHFEFIAIHDVVRQKNYSPFILPMTMMQEMIIGFPYRIGAITALNVQSLKLLISNCLCRTTSCSRTGVYINKLFRNLTNNVRRVEFNTAAMDRHEEWSKWNCFGYRLLKPLFFTDCGTNEEAIDFSLIFRLFSGELETVIIENIVNKPFLSSITLNDAFTRSLVKGLEVVSSSPRLSRTLKEVVIIEPMGDLEQCIQSLQQVVGEQGFKMEKGGYFHSKRGVKSDKCILLKRSGSECRH